MAEGVRFQVDPDGKFQEAIADALKSVDDLRPAFMTIIPSWFQSNKYIFDLSGPGKYKDLKPGYKRVKERKLGSAYPILKFSGLLERSLVTKGDSNSIVEMEKTSLTMGTAVPYGVFHQRGTKKMPQRPFIMIGAEQTGPPEFNKRRELWINSIKSYVLQMIKLGRRG